MSWKSLGVLAAMLAFCASAMAQNNPFLGIWQQKTDTPGELQLIINTPAPDGYTSVRVHIGKDNTNSVENHPVAFDEKPYATTGDDARKISYKRIDANTVQRTQDRNGKIAMDTEQVSKDGKTLTITAGNNVRTFDKMLSVQPVKH